MNEALSPVPTLGSQISTVIAITAGQLITDSSYPVAAYSLGQGDGRRSQKVIYRVIICLRTYTCSVIAHLTEVNEGV